jgi:hypothetical protein
LGFTPDRPAKSQGLVIMRWLHHIFLFKDTVEIAGTCKQTLATRQFVYIEFVDFAQLPQPCPHLILEKVLL